MIRYSHFILACVGVVLGDVMLGLFVKHIDVLIMAIIAMTFFVSTLAFWYEWHQFVDSEMLSIYKSYKNFVDDSRSDVKQDLVGIFVGHFIGLTILTILLKL